MKIVNSIPFIAIAILLMVNSGCKKVCLVCPNQCDTCQSGGGAGVRGGGAALNTAPISNAGHDQYVFSPANFCTLNGAAQDLENNIQTILWSKISGPSSFLIERPDSLSTKVSNLEIGVYQFELTVADSMGMYGKDTIKVTVSQMPANTKEIIIENQIWISPWYNSIEVNNFYDLVPSGSSFRIFIRRDTNPDWIEAFPINRAGGRYEYFIETRPDGAGMYTDGSLYIFYYGDDVSDTPDVKIEFW